MRKYILDVEKSKSVYEYFKHALKVKECYNNVFNVVTYSNATFRNGKWKVAYGYTTVFDNLLCRHCFIIDENDKVIDPTIFTGSQATDREYYTMKVFDDIDDYLYAIEREGFYPALDKHLKEKTAQAQKWAAENGFILCG